MAMRMMGCCAVYLLIIAHVVRASEKEYGNVEVIPNDDSVCVRAGIERSADHAAIKIDGEITDLVASCFKQYIEDGGHHLYIRSSGSEIRSPAYRIGDLIIKQQIPVTIVGYCGSSCAQYIAVLSPRLSILKDALLVFHNSAKSMQELAISHNVGRQVFDTQAQTENRLYRAAHVEQSLLTYPHRLMQTQCIITETEGGKVSNISYAARYRGVILALNVIRAAGVKLAAEDEKLYQDAYDKQKRIWDISKQGVAIDNLDQWRKANRPRGPVTICRL